MERVRFWQGFSLALAIALAVANGRTVGLTVWDRPETPLVQVVQR